MEKDSISILQKSEFIASTKDLSKFHWLVLISLIIFPIIGLIVGGGALGLLAMIVAALGVIWKEIRRYYKHKGQCLQVFKEGLIWQEDKDTKLHILFDDISDFYLAKEAQMKDESDGDNTEESEIPFFHPNEISRMDGEYQETHYHYVITAGDQSFEYSCEENNRMESKQEMTHDKLLMLYIELEVFKRQRIKAEREIAENGYTYISQTIKIGPGVVVKGEKVFTDYNTDKYRIEDGYFKIIVGGKSLLHIDIKNNCLLKLYLLKRYLGWDYGYNFDFFDGKGNVDTDELIELMHKPKSFIKTLMKF